jgi:hypothetical protein
MVPDNLDFAADYVRYTSPDGTYHLRYEYITESSERHYWLSSGEGNSKSAEPPLDIAKLPDYEIAAKAASQYDERLLCSNDSPFLLGKGFAALVISQHRGSSDGYSLMALDLINRKWTALSQNGGYVYHKTSDPGLFAVTEERYQPLAEGSEKSEHTVNCSYLDWYGTDWKRVRFSPPLSALYSATIWRSPSDTLYLIGVGVR